MIFGKQSARSEPAAGRRPAECVRLPVGDRAGVVIDLERGIMSGDHRVALAPGQAARQARSSTSGNRASESALDHHAPSKFGRRLAEAEASATFSSSVTGAGE
jgi:hypothetical protein